MNKRALIVPSILLLSSIAFIVTGSLLLVFGDNWIDSQVKSNCRLVDGTISYQQWVNSSVPMYIRFYVFDLGDNISFIDTGAKPTLKQRGPFVYRERRNKVDISTYANGTISYRETRSYEFVRDMSSEDEQATITTLNLVYMTLVNYLHMKNTSNSDRQIIGVLIGFEDEPWIKLTVKEFLWGYSDRLLASIKKRLPHFIESDIVSVFNNSVSDIGNNVLLINNGVGEERINTVGFLERFNYENRSHYWTDSYANMLNGTDGTLWHPDTTSDERIYTFIPDICRSVYLDFQETYQNPFDIQVHHFAVPDSAYANTPDNRGFCLNSTERNSSEELHCLPDGLFSLSTCVHLDGSSVQIPLPIIASSPHFLGADPEVQNAIDGLKPDDSKHRSFVEIEPITGLVMNGSRRLQININVVNDSSISAIKNIRPMVFPMIWIDEHAELDQSTADMFHNKVTLPISLIKILKYVGVAVGACLFTISILVGIYRWRKNREQGSPFLSPRMDSTTPLLS